VAADPNKAYTMTQFETAQNSQVGNIPGINQFVRDRYSYLRNYLNGQAQPVDVRLNELVVNHDGQHKDEAGDADPWVEIHNVGPGPVSLSGFYLSDDPANPTKWALPSITLADGQFLVVWLDGETSEGTSHANFRVPSTGGKLYLFSTAFDARSALDTLTVADTSAGQSQVRLGLYGTRWEVTSTPTPNADNVLKSVSANPASSLLLISEFMADNDSVYQDPDEPGAYEDWFEIYNPGTEAVDMSGMYITDNPQNPKKWQVGQGVVIPAGGYLVFMADNEPAQGPRHAAFALSADGESISLYDKDGVTLIDTVTFGPQRKDVSYGRNGTEWGFMVTPTPGAPNSAILK
jgi:hypothetical protein